MFTPQIGVRGLYTLTDPFSSKLISGVQYTCSAVRSISDLINKGETPYDTYYKPYDITAATYELDIAAGVSIVTLEAAEQHVVYVPSTYISGYPEIGGVSYVSMMIGAQLGPIKEGFDLSLLTDKVSQIILEYIGVAAEVKLIAASLPKLLSHSTANALESARAANISVANTDHTAVVRLQQENDTLIQKVNLLETYIRDHAI